MITGCDVAIFLCFKFKRNTTVVLKDISVYISHGRHVLKNPEGAPGQGLVLCMKILKLGFVSTSGT